MDCTASKVVKEPRVDCAEFHLLLVMGLLHLGNIVKQPSELDRSKVCGLSNEVRSVANLIGLDSNCSQSGRPVSSFRACRPLGCFLASSLTVGVVLASGQAMALCSASPVSLSQTTVVSRWLVTPITLPRWEH